VSAGERTVERYKQDRNVFVLLMQTNAISDVAVLSSNEMTRLEDSAKMKFAAVADNPQTLSVTAAYRTERRILSVRKLGLPMPMRSNLTAAPDR